MPVHRAVITSKRARRGRSSHESSPVKESPDATRLRRKLKEGADSRTNSPKPDTRRFEPSLASTRTPAAVSELTSSSASVSMSTWQASGIAPPSSGMTMSQNTCSIGNENGTDSPPKSPAKAGDQLSGVELSFKKRRSFSSRKRDVDEIVTKHPHKVPIIIERARKERSLSLLDKSKFLVPEELTMSQLTTIIRRRLQLSDTQAFYLIVNRRSMVSASMTLAEVYRNDRDEDGFLYIVYASQEMFG